MPMQDLRSVLYVDDDPDICTVVEATLCAIGDLAVRSASSGEMAMDLACEEQPDLILMDVMMPGLDGPSTLKLMRDCAPLADIPVIFLTAKVMPTEVTEFLNLGAIGVIGKPFDPTRLCRDIRALWERTGRSCAVRPASATRTEELAAEVTTLTGSFLQRMQRDVRRLRHLLERLAVGDGSALRELERLAHTIHGSAAMFGFPAISECGGMIERLMVGKSATEAIDPSVLRQLSDCTDRLSEVLDTEGTALQPSAHGSSAAGEATARH
jgi:two-component system, OmpR family, response regulator